MLVRRSPLHPHLYLAAPDAEGDACECCGEAFFDAIHIAGAWKAETHELRAVIADLSAKMRATQIIFEHLQEGHAGDLGLFALALHHIGMDLGSMSGKLSLRLALTSSLEQLPEAFGASPGTGE